MFKVNYCGLVYFLVVVLACSFIIGCPPQGGPSGNEGQSEGEPDITEGEGEGETMAVPNVVDRTQASAQSAITSAGLIVGTITTNYSDIVPEGYVISQNPSAGTSVAPNSAVTLVISKGPESVTVPACVGQTQAAAQSAITSAGLVVGTVTQAYSATVPEGQVISQNPAAGADVPPNTPVEVSISLGAAEGPTAAFTMNHNSGEAPLIVQFEDTSMAGSEAITGWSWNFDDTASGTDNFSTFQNPSHAFNTEGTYSVSLTVTTAYGSDSVSHNVTVSPGQGEVVSQDVRVVDDIPKLSLDTESGSDYTFTYTGNGVPPVEPGDILVGTEGEGYLRRVSAVKSWHTKANGAKSVSISTEFCSLNEAVDTGTLELDAPIQFTPEDFEKAGIACTKDGSPYLSFQDLTFSENSGWNLDLDASVAFNPAIDVRLSIQDGSVTYFKIEPSGVLELDIDVVLESFKSQSVAYKKSVLEFLGLPKPYHACAFLIGPVPVCIITELDWVFELRLESGKSFSAHIGFDSTSTLTLGAEYVSGQWHDLSALTLDTNFHGLTWEIDSTLSVRAFLKPKVNFKFYGVVGPFVAAKPYAGIDVEYTASSLEGALVAGVDHAVGFELWLIQILGGDFTMGYARDVKGPFWKGPQFTVGGVTGLAVDKPSVSLDSSNPSATVTVTNVDEGTLSWSAVSNDGAVIVSPSAFTGNNREVTISTSDFSSDYTATVTFTSSENSGDTASVTVNVTGITGGSDITPGEMVSVAAGTFEMGDPWSEGALFERPVHDVTLSAYQIGKYEATNQECADILNWANALGYMTTASASTALAFGEELLDVDASYCQISYSEGQFVVDTRDGHSMADHPVVAVSWYGAAAYCNWLSESQGLQECYNTSTWTCDFSKNGYHLPTEAQWERAAAWDAGSSYHYRYGNGSDSISRRLTANYNQSNPLGLSSYPYTSPVGYYSDASSPTGCYDMSGNVSEWSNDRYFRTYTESPVTDPEGPTTGWQRLLRGGGWERSDIDDFYVRSAQRRDCDVPVYSSSSRGFRVARSSGGDNPSGPPDLSVSANNVELTESSNSATVTVSNVGDGALTWSAVSNDAAVMVSPSVFTGNNRQVTISTSNFSESYTVQVTFTNDDDGTDWESVDVSVTGTGGGEGETWQRTFGGTSSDDANSVQQTTDGGYILVGGTYSFGAGERDMYLVKTDASGNEVWAKTFGGDDRDHAYSVQQTTDGGYILAGDTGVGEYDMYLVKTDASGNEVWAKTFGGRYDDYAYSVQQTTDGGYILAGFTASFGVGEYNMYLVKTDASGNEAWAKTFGGTSGDYAHSVQQTTDGGYILVGYVSSYGAGSIDMYLVKTDSTGNCAMTDPTQGK